MLWRHLRVNWKCGGASSPFFIGADPVKVVEAAIHLYNGIALHTRLYYEKYLELITASHRTLVCEQSEDSKAA